MNFKSFRMKYFFSFLLFFHLNSLNGQMKQKQAINDAPGRLIKVDDSTQLHLYSAGEGNLRVIFSTGIGSPSAYTDYYLIIKQLSAKMRVCAYDRAGYGWSDAGDLPQNLPKTVTQLHTLLQNANEKPPYLLVAHSLGALEMLLFASQYPDKVAGIVLIDGVSPHTYDNFDSSKAVNIFTRINKNRSLFKIVGNLGCLKDLNQRKKFLPPEIFKMDKQLILNNFANQSMIEVAKSVKANAQFAQKNIALNNLPLLIITAEQSISQKTFPFTNWATDQKYLLTLSTKSQQVFINSEHTIILLEKANEIAEQIINFSESIKYK
jgi:pimeloyl-ACP methyl ester carboxylesterase